MNDVSWWELASKVLIPLLFALCGFGWKLYKDVQAEMTKIKDKADEELKEARSEADDNLKEIKRELNKSIEDYRHQWIKEIENTRAETQSLSKQILALQLKIVETYPTKNDLMELEQRIIDRMKMVLESKLGH